MILCHCRAVSDREIRRAVEAGASSVDEIGRACGAGTDCGRCRPVLESIVSCASLRLRVAPSPVALPVPAPQAA